MAVSEMGAQGVSALPLLVVEHPLGGERPEAIARRAQQAFEQLHALIAGSGTSDRTEPTDRASGATAASNRPPTAEADLAAPATIDIPDDPIAILDAFTERNWADGLPIIAPTAERVSAMLDGRDAAKSLGIMPPLWRQVTLEKLAVNAVMAGCEPRAFPIILAAVEAMLDRAFNLYGVQATTHPVAPLLVVNGAYGRQIGLHGGSGCFGPGFRANATIGRAIRLILLNVGGAWPGRYDMATQGSPAKFSYCIAENEAASPWGPLAEGDTVTVYGGEPPHNVNDHVSTTASGILTTVCDTAVSLGSNVGWYFSQSQLLVVLGPEHARTIADDGFTRADVQRFVYEHARLPLGRLKLAGMWGMHDWPAWMNAVADPEALMPQVPSPDDVFVAVAGGSGKHSAVVPNCTFSRAVSRPIKPGGD
ncbi:MAG: hypothetical protein DME02_08275 [Candidatus Rokuibacteriota bacterium]|nr:MAG: hypothetical protein DME02_08275 [Candidatus Rokubacteria bacterium]